MLNEILKRIHEKKRKLDAYGPLPIELIHNLENWYRISFTYASNAIEGNTLSHDETAMVVEEGLTIGGKSLREHQEAMNHSDAVKYIQQLAQTKKRIAFNARDILDIHKIVLQRIDDNNAGSFRRVAVRVLGSSTIFPNFLKVPDLVDEFAQWLVTASEDEVTVAALAHFKLVSIHPFVDGNGRTSRLLMNLILLEAGYPVAVIKPEDRSTYIKAIEHARQQGDMHDFLMVVYIAVERSLDDYLSAAADSGLKAS